ncbi:M28 family peptidase [Rubrimonas sp.]|uniref:M28 family peptidase n=1 Tax=Rubrimonas sp. TaxID=2036015 RepID=UPI002FDE437B
MPGDLSERASTGVVGDVSADRVRAHVERIVREIPHRAAGSENGRRMAEYARDALVQADVADARLHELPAIVSFPEHADFRLETPRRTEIVANTLGHSTLTGPEGVRGELVYVGSGAFPDYEGKDVRGKIILTELSYAPARHEKQRIAAMKGAIGAVMMNWGHPENEAVPFGSVKPAWGVPTPDTFANEMPQIPCIGIARVAGLELKELALKGGAEVWLRTHVENPWRPIQITVGEIAAPQDSPEPEDFVLLGGHQDSWPGEAATDNAAGNACMIELARAFAARRGELRRGVVLGFWTAHETGTMSGSTWFADTYWDRLRANAVAYLQIDQPACLGTSRWATSSNAELKAFHSRVEKAVVGAMPTIWKRASKTGDSSFYGIGIPLFHGEMTFTEQELKDTALATLGWWHHSLENRLDKLDWALMALHLKVYAAWLWELCTAPVLPFRFAPVAEQITTRLAELAPAGAAVGLDGVLARAEGFAAAAGRLDAAAEDWAGRFARGAGDEDVARLLNGAMKRLSRILVPLQSQEKGPYGQDPYGYTPQGTMLPCLYDLPALAKAEDGPERWMLATEMRRRRNRVADGVGDATRVIDDALALLGKG